MLIRLCPSFFNASMSFNHLRHSLLNDGVSSCFANDKIGPLHDHNTGKECCVACILHYFSAFICLYEEEGEKKEMRDRKQML